VGRRLDGHQRAGGTAGGFFGSGTIFVVVMKAGSVRE
jgi:hypothetical protein